MIQETEFEKQNKSQFEKSYVKYFSNNAIFRNTNADFVLPIVFHIIHDDGPENISDNQIHQALHDLNDAFANVEYYNPKTGVPTQISFCLARQSPDSTTTSGINRKKSFLTEMTAESEDFRVKNLIRWKPTEYINIWVVREICSETLGCGLVGYSSNPSAHGKDKDGIVIEADYVGNSHSKSIILVHEMGHFLGLYHTFTDGCENSNCLEDGDKVCDTPPDNSTLSIDCDKTENTCHTDVNFYDDNNYFKVDQDDMTENYMDYGNIECFNAFTEGQRDRMYFTIENTRKSLIESIVCCEPITANFSKSDVSPIQVSSTIDFTNISKGEATYQWFIDGVLFSTEKNTSFTFKNQGIFEIELKASNSCYSLSEKRNVIVQCPIKSIFFSSQTNVELGDTIYFENKSTNADTYQWILDGQIMDQNKDFKISFSKTGTYGIQLIATKEGACSDTSAIKIITVYDEKIARGLPQWIVTSNKFLGNIDWQLDNPIIQDQIIKIPYGRTSIAIDNCGEIAFFTSSYTWDSKPNNIFLYSSNGKSILPNGTNGSGLNGTGSEIQIIRVPNSNNEWYIIYLEHLTHHLIYSRVLIKGKYDLEIIERDIILSVNENKYNYSNGLAISTLNEKNEQFLVANRNCLTDNCNTVSLDKWIITENGIIFQKNTGAIQMPFPVHPTYSTMEISPRADKIAVRVSEIETKDTSHLFIVDLNSFSNTSVQNIDLQDLILIADGTSKDESSILDRSLKISDILESEKYDLDILKKFGRIRYIEFSPNGRFLYFTASELKVGYGKKFHYLGQIDLKTNPLETRMQIQDIEQKALNDIQSSYDGNIYFQKFNSDTIFVIPDPNDILPQNLIPSNINLQNSSNKNIAIFNDYNLLPEQIDGFNYTPYSNNCNPIEIIIQGQDCEGECIDSFYIEIISETDQNIIETRKISSCSDTFSLNIDSTITYSLRSTLSTEIIDSVIVWGEISQQSFLFKESCCQVQASFNSTDFSYIKTNENVYFENTSTNAARFEWLVNGQKISESQNFNYIFSENGVYDVQLLAFENDSCQASSYIKIITVTETGEEPKIGIPNLLQLPYPSAFNGCGEIMFYVNNLRLYFANHEIATTKTLKANMYDNAEIQIIRVPNRENQWYIIYSKFNQLLFSQVLLKTSNEIIFLKKDIPLSAGNDTYPYWKGKATSPFINNNKEHFLYAARKSKNDFVSLDKWLITENEIEYVSNTNDIEFPNTPVEIIELSHDGEKIAILGYNFNFNQPNILIIDAKKFDNIHVQSIIPNDLVLLADGTKNDSSNILPYATTLRNIPLLDHLNIGHLTSFENHITDIEFSPNGRFLYAIFSPSLFQIDLQKKPYEVRLQNDISSDFYPITEFNTLKKIESNIDGNLYFTKQNKKLYFVIPDPNNILPQKLIPSSIDLSTNQELNIASILSADFQDPIDGLDYYDGLSFVDVIVSGLDCDHQCLKDYKIKIISETGVIESETIDTCPDTIQFCINSNQIYSIQSLDNQIKYDSAIVFGEVQQTEPFDFTDLSCCDQIINKYIDTTICQLPIVIDNHIVQTKKDTFTVRNNQGCKVNYFVNVHRFKRYSYDTISICMGDTVTIFDKKRYTKGSFYKRYKSQNGCDSTHVIELRVSNIKTNITTNVICEDAQDGTIDVGVENGFPPYQFQWSNTNQNISNQDSLLAGVYQLTVTDSMNCSVVNSIEIKELKIKTTILQEDVSCFEGRDGAIFFYSGSTNLSNSIDGIEYSDASDFKNLGAATYNVFVKDNHGCVLQKEITISEPDKLWVNIGEDLFIEKGETIEIIPKSNGFPSIYQWDSNNEIDCINCSNLVLNPDTTSFYTLEIENESGCTARDSMNIFVNDIYEVYIPNVFTPNDDHINDSFCVFGKGIRKIISLQIFDRDQLLIFEMNNFDANDISLGWNGYSSSDIKMDQGVYYYKIKVLFFNDTSDVIWGDVTLLR